MVGILLAAGYGRRFGGDKLSHPLVDGLPMAVVAARALRAACPHSVAVVRPEQVDLAGRLAAEGLTVVTCAAAREGMGYSLAAGVTATPEAAGWVVALGDMPFVQPGTLRQVADALTDGAALAAPFHAGRRGHPVGFAARWRDALRQLTGDAGARAILGAHGDLLWRIESDDAGVLRDVDTPEDLLRPA
ncbi:NTP transferase domain-containing protein [Zoogloea sp.]|uniref:nucleotidyltransferase family protein n=1 Tax=Zoogloea sp. TaxID=49181 RepID=UPI0035AFDDB4